MRTRHVLIALLPVAMFCVSAAGQDSTCACKDACPEWNIPENYTQINNIKTPDLVLCATDLEPFCSDHFTKKFGGLTDIVVISTVQEAVYQIGLRFTGWKLNVVLGGHGNSGLFCFGPGTAENSFSECIANDGGKMQANKDNFVNGFSPGVCSDHGGSPWQACNSPADCFGICNPKGSSGFTNCNDDSICDGVCSENLGLLCQHGPDGDAFCAAAGWGECINDTCINRECIKKPGAKGMIDHLTFASCSVAADPNGQSFLEKMRGALDANMVKAWTGTLWYVTVATPSDPFPKNGLYVEKGEKKDVFPPPDPHATPELGPGSSTFDFGTGGTSPPIPADFFGPGSDPFVGTVELRGNPIDTATLGDTSTLVQRTGAPVEPIDPAGTQGTVDIEIVALSLVSVAPITVTYNGGQNPEEWDVSVGLSDIPAPIGSLTATKTHANGGTFDTTLLVQPKLTFTNVSNPSQTGVLDTGFEGTPPINFSAAGMPFVHSVDPSLRVLAPSDGTFVPGVEQIVPGDPSTQVTVPGIEEDPGTPARHTITTATLCGNNVLDPNEQCDGTADAKCPGNCQPDCTCAPGSKIPAVSEWGLGVMLLLVLTAGTVLLGRRRYTAA